MIPLALGRGADPSFRSPMAMAVMGGLITSALLSLLSLLSLLMMPAVFTHLDDLEHAIKWITARLRHEPPATVTQPAAGV